MGETMSSNAYYNCHKRVHTKVNISLFTSELVSIILFEVVIIAYIVI